MLTVGFRADYSASVLSYSLVHECACTCIPYTNVHANVLSPSACYRIRSCIISEELGL